MDNIFKIFKIILSSLLAMSLLGFTVVQLIIIYSSDELNKLIVVEVFEPGPRASSARVLATDGIVNYEVHHCPMKTQVGDEIEVFSTVIGDYVICTSIRVWWVWISFVLSVAFVIGVGLLVKEFIEKGSEFEF
jgi:hypothetical protein